jgi:hypothetical protein
MAFDLAFPVSSVISGLVNCVLVIASILLADFVINHHIELKNIVIMSLVAYFIGPIFADLVGSLLPLYVPYLISYILPLLFWIIAGEIILKDYSLTLEKKATIAALGFIIFIIMSFLQVQMLLISMLRM